MTLLGIKGRRPSQERNDRLLQQKEEMGRLVINIPLKLKKRLEMRSVLNSMKMTEVLLRLIEKYLNEEDKKEGK